MPYRPTRTYIKNDKACDATNQQLIGKCCAPDLKESNFYEDCIFNIHHVLH